MASKAFSQKDKILQLETRKKIYALVKKHAGCHFRDLERKSKLPPTSLKYHLNYLTKHGLITEEKEGNNLRYFPNEFNSDNRVLLGLLRQESIKKILVYMLANKNCRQEDIARFSRLSASTVSWYLKKLTNKRIIRAVKEGRNIRYSLFVNENEIINLLITYQIGFIDDLVNRTIEMWEI